MPEILIDLLSESAQKTPESDAIVFRQQPVSYSELLAEANRFSSAMTRLGLGQNDRIAIFLPKIPENVVAIFGTGVGARVFVPVNPVLMPPQVGHILKDCTARVLITTFSRAESLLEELGDLPSLRAVIVVDEIKRPLELKSGEIVHWPALMRTGTSVSAEAPLPLSTDIAAIFYTSGSTGSPKGVVLSHRNMVIGAVSVASYLNNSSEDRILSALPLSFDAGFSQLTTGIFAGATVVLHDYLFPADVLKIAEKERVTGITGVPPLWIQLAALDWPPAATENLRYFATTGGKMPRATLDRLRSIFPSAEPFLMYGLTEAFRSTYLPPSEVDRRPDSIGKAIPNAQIMVIGEDGKPCGPNEPGELVHRGPLVALGYWNDKERTRERFRPTPGLPDELPIPEMAVWSGDIVKRDEDGFLYFVGRKDSMIKTSGYRVSPTEIEEVAYGSGLAGEAIAFGIEDADLGQAIVLMVAPKDGSEADTDRLLQHFRSAVPNFMMPSRIEWRSQLPRNPNGKLDKVQVVNDYVAGEQAAASRG